VKFIHTAAAGYVAGSMFVLGISSWYLIKGRDIAFAKRSFSVAAGFGLASVLSVIVLGDESGYEVGDVQKTKLATIESEWETEPAPAAFTLIGFPSNEEQRTIDAIKIPYALGIIATRSVDQVVPGLKELMARHEVRIRNGMIAYGYLVRLRGGDHSPELIEKFEATKVDLGYGLLLKRYAPNITDATEAQIQQAVRDSIPEVAPVFWAFRVMVAAGFTLLGIFLLSFYFCAKRAVGEQRWLLYLALWSIPLPWIAIETGWFVAEFGRQPWAIGEVLPTFMAASSLEVSDVIISLSVFLVFYAILFVIEMWLMFHYARIGPSTLHTGRYHFERDKAAADNPATIAADIAPGVSPQESAP